jgi:hypothetical protein
MLIGFRNAKEYLSGYGKVWDEAVGLLTPVIEERREMAGEMPVRFFLQAFVVMD